MNGIKMPECFKGIKRTDFYEKKISPYELPPKSNLNIGALSAYLIKNNKTIEEISNKEVLQFII